MYMLRSRSGTNDRYYPADRCTFRTVQRTVNGVGTGEYEVSISPAAQFVTDGAADIPGAGVAATRPILGYISKTGRFVDITVE